jgi:hypothetical protein
MNIAERTILHEWTGNQYLLRSTRINDRIVEEYGVAGKGGLIVWTEIMTGADFAHLRPLIGHREVWAA